jgi:hypothetical protein
VVLAFDVKELVGRDRSLSVRKSMVADILRLRVPTGPLTTLRSRPLLSLVTLCVRCCLDCPVYPSPTLPHPSLLNFFTIYQSPINQQRRSCYTMALRPFDIHASFLAPLSVATAANVLRELPSLLSTRPLIRRPEPVGTAFVRLRTFKPKMAFRRPAIGISCKSPP